MTNQIFKNASRLKKETENLERKFIRTNSRSESVKYPESVEKAWDDLNISFLDSVGVKIKPFEYDFVYSHMPIKPMQRNNDDKIEKKIYKNIQNSTFYIHIPFCNRECSYCYFYKKTNFSDEEVDLYLKYLKKEFNILKSHLGDLNFIKSIYIGGGTPSVLNERQLEYLFNIFSRDIQPIEIALEMHPENISREKILLLKKLGATRISFGIQTFDDDLLKLLNRGGSKKEILEKINTVKEVFDNWNIDLIFGLPYQRKDHIMKDADLILKINPPSVTWYEVWFSPRKAEIKIPIELIPKYLFMSEKDFIKTKIYIDLFLIGNGYENFYNDWYVLKKDFSTIYQEYKIKNKGNIGIGLGIYQYFNKITFESTQDFNKYFSKISNGNLPIAFYSIMDKKRINIKKIILGIKGLIPFNYAEAYFNFPEPMIERLDNLIKNDIFYIAGNRTYLNKKYYLLRDYLIIYLLGGYGWKILKR